MRSGVIKSLYRKEILDVLRDKRTVLMMVIVPLILYPLIFVVSLTVMSNISTSITTAEYKVALDFTPDDELLELLKNDTGSKNSWTFAIVPVHNMKEALAAEEIDAYIEKDDASYTIHYLSSVNNSGYAADYLTTVLDRYKDSLVKRRLAEEGLDAYAVLTPIKYGYSDEAKGEETAGNLLGMILPFMLVVSLLMGTMYPAIDTTSGERERGTLETLLTLPISNRELIVSKFLAVATIGLASAALNILSMAFVGVYMYKMMLKTTGMGSSASLVRFIPVIFVCILCVLAFAIFISALTMCVTAFAKSYKEANNLITPMMITVMFLSFLSFLPNVSLNSGVALVPVANVCLLVKELLAFKYDLLIIFIVLASNVVYGVLAVMFLSKIYDSESILFGEEGASVQIFERRRDMKKGGVPAVGDAWLVALITVIAVIYLGGAMQLKYGYIGLLSQQFIIIGVPLLAAWYTKKDMKMTFSLNPVALKQLIAAALMGLGGTCLASLLGDILSKLMVKSAESLNSLNEQISDFGFVEAFVLIVVAPAVCEEFLFRGYILTAFRGKYRVINAILVSSAIFGLYHMSLIRFFGTFVLGVLNCYVVVKTGSIFPAMLMHFLNNGIGVIQLYVPGMVLPSGDSLSNVLLLLGIGIIGLGAGGLMMGTFREIGKKVG
ncbi:MAG: CPBP family intramembrane metalloprotease [Lachnospiraceae bacterium]|nr:CPBP family intramembrane metalloprotease [Lachnospiraceae bacterium]